MTEQRDEAALEFASTKLILAAILNPDAEVTMGTIRKIMDILRRHQAAWCLVKADASRNVSRRKWLRQEAADLVCFNPPDDLIGGEDGRA